jgi:predicted DNA binding CopG/RHH family protein
MAENERQARAVPQFANAQEEADFWDMHDSTTYLGATEPVAVTFVDARPTKQQISLRLEPAVIEQLKKIARTKGVGYQTMIRMWVMERLEQVGGGV